MGNVIGWLLAAFVFAAGLIGPPAARPAAAAENAGANVNGRNVKTVFHAAGMFRMQGAGQWIEEGDNGRKFSFEEQSRDNSSVVLFDAGRNFRVRLDLKQREILLAVGNGQFSPLYSIARATAAITPPRTAEQICAAAIQGKVAWNRAGDKNWEPGNLRWLCESTALVDAAIECFRREIQSNDDWDRAIRTCTEGRHEVEVLYVVPKDKQARPDIEKALAAIMAVTQRHYFVALGVTFKLKTPLVQVLHIDEPSETFKKEGTMLERCSKLAKNEFKADYMYKENAVICFFEADTASAGGAGNLVGLPIWVWGPGYEQFRKDPSADLSKIFVLGAISHEMGHAFGLLHTEDARACFKKHGVDLGTLPKLIMQDKNDPRHTSVYDVPFHAQEKRLLLDPDYLPDCRPFIDNRPHASWHLRNPLPSRNAGAPSAATLPVVAALPSAANPTATVTGRNVKMVRFAAGSFRMTGMKLWVEEDGKGATKFRFAEEDRDNSSVVLFDPGRNYRIRVDLKQRQILLAVGASQFSPLYPITDASSTEGGSSTGTAP